MAALGHNLYALEMILKSSQITNTDQVLRNINCLMICHAECVTVLVSDSQITVT